MNVLIKCKEIYYHKNAQYNAHTTHKNTHPERLKYVVNYTVNIENVRFKFID